MPNNAPHNALRGAVNRAIASGAPIFTNKPDIAAPNNEADMTVNLAISGNRLVSILNALDAAMHETGRYRFHGNQIIGMSDWYDDLRATTEAVRDELSRQRCAAREV